MTRRLRSPGLLLLATAGVACAARRPASPAEGSSDAGVVRVLTWNIHAGADSSGVPNLERVAARIRAERADVVLLQEVDRGVARSGGVDQPAVLARLTGLHAAFRPSLAYQGGDYGLAVLSRWPVAHDTMVPLPVDPPQRRSGGLTTPRGALVARLARPSGTLVVVNTHIDASRDDRWRQQEAARVAALADSLVRQPGTVVVVGGDMNSEPGSATQALLQAGTLRDAWRACGAGPDSLTYPSTVPRKRIDWLYLTGPSTCARARVLPDPASDHRALLVELRP